MAKYRGGRGCLTGEVRSRRSMLKSYLYYVRLRSEGNGEILVKGYKVSVMQDA